MRSGEYIPPKVSPPYKEVSKTGRTVDVNWRRPDKAHGVIVNYTLIAYVVPESIDKVKEGTFCFMCTVFKPTFLYQIQTITKSKFVSKIHLRMIPSKNIEN